MLRGYMVRERLGRPELHHQKFRFYICIFSIDSIFDVVKQRFLSTRILNTAVAAAAVETPKRRSDEHYRRSYAEVGYVILLPFSL